MSIIGRRPSRDEVQSADAWGLGPYLTGTDQPELDIRVRGLFARNLRLAGGADPLAPAYEIESARSLRFADLGSQSARPSGQQHERVSRASPAPAAYFDQRPISAPWSRRSS